MDYVQEELALALYSALTLWVYALNWELIKAISHNCHDIPEGQHADGLYFLIVPTYLLSVPDDPFAINVSSTIAI